ncbi:hypothetical protein NQ318_002185 [Aromia moschata]|uniref:Major facilitator superfamily (MFS) profile domain-containing protein n=1 Tax=Aromia moschata TaxID=1265417 RepID=A0AAV8Z3C7_9CUCU|nr:hypothetical protein NQ318_002185 [Aromia moschata]
MRKHYLRIQQETGERWSVSLVVALATAVAILDVFFILVAVPESLSEKVRLSPISWEQADPFASLRNVGQDPTILLLCIAVFLSYLPEAGQYSCIFVYLKLVMGWSAKMVAVFVGLVGLLAVITQLCLGILIKNLGSKHTIMLGLLFEMLQLLWYGFGTTTWMMWGAGILASMSSITYPAISAFVSVHSTPDRQGVVQGMVTGMRGLCNGFGPAMFGLIFFMFHVDLNGAENNHNATHSTPDFETYTQLMPGPPFVFGAFLVICAILVASFIPSKSQVDTSFANHVGIIKKLIYITFFPDIPLDTHYEMERGQKVAGTLSPLIPSRSIDAAIL